jgi:L-lactate dehydrogenase complex protein LldG
MLARIREHLAASPPASVGHHEPLVKAAGGEPPAEVNLIDLFRAGLEAVNGNCAVVANEKEAVAKIRQVIEFDELHRIAISDSPLVERLARDLEGSVELLRNAAAPLLFECDAGITSVQWAIAETGTLVLESKGERHRLVSLVPPVHIAVVEAGRIRRTMAEVLRNVSTSDELSRTVTFITGPSRTSDIELTLAIGVHGPAKLHVIVIEEGEQTV